MNFSFGCPPQILPPIGKSNHCVVVCRESTHPRPTVRKVETRKFSVSHRALLDDIVVRPDWLALGMAADDVDSRASSLLDLVFSLYDHCFPTRVVRFRSSDPPWIRPLKILIDDRNRAFSCRQTRLRNTSVSDPKSYAIHASLRSSS